MAVFAIPLLIGLGVWLALPLAGGPGALLGSSYGRLLLLKLAVGLGAMVLGALNKQFITARVIANAPQGRRWLRTALLAEAALFLIAIVSVSAATTIAGPSD
jgi:putative copper export protein